MSGTRIANCADALAITGSVACMIHCLLLPVVISLLPAYSDWLGLPEGFHLWFLVIALPVSLYALGRHSLRQGRKMPFLLGIAGLAIMAVALGFEGKWFEPLITTLGAGLLVYAHWQNWRGRKTCQG